MSSSIKFGTCPQCGAREIYKSPKQKLSRHAVKTNAFGNWIFVNSDWNGLKGVTLIHYVCASCHYLESYLADAGALSVIKEEWERLEPGAAKPKNDAPGS